MTEINSKYMGVVMGRKEDEGEVRINIEVNCYLFALCCFLFFLIAWSETSFACSLGWFVAMGCFLYTAFKWAFKIK